MNPHFTTVGGKIKKKENPESKIKRNKTERTHKEILTGKKKTQNVELEKEPTSQNLASILAIDVST